MENLKSPYVQSGFDVRTEVGPVGLTTLLPEVDVVVIVDALSFTTCVSIGCERGASLYPFAWKDERARAFAKSLHAELAGKRGGQSRFTLAPASLLQAEPSMKIVLPSPNGSHLSTLSPASRTMAGCLRNASAVARCAAQLGRRIAVIQAGERWESDNSLRPSFEDFLVAGAIIHALPGSRSPEARLAEAAFRCHQNELLPLLRDCSSGRELIQRGYAEDVELAAQWDVSEVVPVLHEDRCYRAF